MGCVASKVENEDVVRRCKERRHLMKQAVFSRHHLAAAHFDYLRSLRLTASSLSTFASNEPLSISDDTPPVYLHPIHTTTTTFTTPIPPTPTSTYSFTQPQPPPPPTTTTPPPPHPHFTPPSPTITSSKLPHILSQSSPTSSPTHKEHASKYPHYPKYPHLPTFSTYSSTPSQASSVWNWENFYPPSPPDSEFFQRRHDADDDRTSVGDRRSHFDDQRSNFDDRRSNFDDRRSNFDDQRSNFDDRRSNFDVRSQFDNRSSLGEHDERHHHHLEQREEVQCSDWGDHYSSHTSSLSSDDEVSDHHREARRDDGNDADESKSEAPTRSNFGGSSSVGNGVRESEIGEKFVKKERSEMGSSMDGALGMNVVVKHRNLVEIVKAIEEYFNKAADAGEAVSQLLEVGRAQFDRSFRQLKKTVYHSNSVLSTLSSTWTSKPPLAIRYKLDTVTLDNSGGNKSHASTLERLLAWEKKLYQEVKAREGVKIDHQRKLSALQSQEYRGHAEAKLDKTKAAITILHSHIVVTSQAVTTTSSEIIKLRDNELAMQLVELCHGLMLMWRSMNEFHEVQNHIVQQVRGLVNRARAGDSTSDLHRQATRDLESAVATWHSSFCRIVKYQRDYIHSLHGWLKLSLINVDDEKNSAVCSTPISSKLFRFCDEWKQALDRLPDPVASEAIKSFVSVIHSISVKQNEEIKMKKRTDSASKELEKKATSLRNIERKFYQSYSTVGIGLPDTGRSDSGGQVFDARDPLADKKSEMEACRRRVEDEMLKHAKAIEATRAMTLNNIQTGLPGVFQAMTGFSGVFAESLESVCRFAVLS